MNWHYSNDGKQIGPIGEEAFEDSVKTGVIHADTLVWKEGFPEWIKYSQVSQGSLGGGVALATSARCAECGGEFPQGEMINFSGAWVCAGCKPQYVQKIKEGVHVGGGFIYAGFWIRFVAKFLDGILLKIVGYIFGAMTGVVGATGGTAGVQKAAIIASGVAFAIQITYNTFFIGKYGATLGKMATKTKVVRPNGEPIGYPRALGRAFAEILSGLLLGIGYLMVAWDPEKRGLHDRICDTRVVKS